MVTGLERREVVVSGALVAHQLRSFLKAHAIRWQMDLQQYTPLRERTDTRKFTIDATPEQWEKISEWVEQTEVKR